MPNAPAPPEITVKAVILGIVLSIVLAGANAYLGLQTGMTVSASIPAAVISMAVLRLFRRSNILENNIVQTAASAGESLAAGVVFTLPALILMGAWQQFNYVETTLIAGLGGLLGVLFTIPLRRALIVEANLKFPEGVATAEVLEVGHKGKTGVRYIVWGSLLGAIAKIGHTGLGLWTGTVETAWRAGGTVWYLGTNAAPALTGVGYIVGINIAVLVFLGGALNWFIAIPIYASLHADPGTAADAWAWDIWSTQTRYLGVGAMVVGGLWAIIRLWKSLMRGIASGIAAHRKRLSGEAGGLPRTERDVPMHWVGAAVVLSAVPLYFLFAYLTGRPGIAAFMAVAMLVAGFLFSAVASYMAGIVGSSNNPISGVTIATLLTTALILLMLGMDSSAGPMAAILVAGVVCCAAAIGGDNLQDLKTGHIVGATPWKQQVMQAVGVLSAAAAIALLVSLLHGAYGIGVKDALHPNAMPAPQATLMKSVAVGVFEGGLPWGMAGIGAGLAAVIIAIDLVLERAGSAFRMPVLAVAVGVYLPLELGVAILIGGLISWAAKGFGRRSGMGDSLAGPGLLLAAGLITGEALLGILLAIPIVANKGENPLNLGLTAAHWPGMVLLGIIAIVLYRAATKPETE